SRPGRWACRARRHGPAMYAARPARAPDRRHHRRAEHRPNSGSPACWAPTPCSAAPAPRCCVSSAASFHGRRAAAPAVRRCPAAATAPCRAVREHPGTLPVRQAAEFPGAQPKPPRACPPRGLVRHILTTSTPAGGVKPNSAAGTAGLAWILESSTRVVWPTASSSSAPGGPDRRGGAPRLGGRDAGRRGETELASGQRRVGLDIGKLDARGRAEGIEQLDTRRQVAPHADVHLRKAGVGVAGLGTQPFHAIAGRQCADLERLFQFARAEQNGGRRGADCLVDLAYGYLG